MAELSKIFKTNDLYEAWRDNKNIPSNVLAVVLDETGADVQKVAFGTNNIAGEYETYEVEKSTTQPLQAVGYMFGDYVSMPMYEMGSGVDYPCDYLTITTNEDGFTNYEGYIYIKYNRPLTDEEATAEMAKITGEYIESSNITVNRIPDEDDILEIRWSNLDDYMTTDIMYINYDGSAICSFSNELYAKYCDTAIIMMGSTAPITAQSWKNNVEVNNIIMDNECASLYPIGATGEYHIMITAKDYQRINFPIEILFNNGQNTVDQYTLTTADNTFLNNGLRAYVFNFKDVASPSTVNNVQLYWGNATYIMNFV